MTNISEHLAAIDWNFTLFVESTRSVLHGSIFAQDSLAFFGIKPRLQRVNPKACRIVTLESEAVGNITGISFSEDCGTTTRCSRITLLILFVINCIIEVALSQVKVDTVKTKKFG